MLWITCPHCGSRPIEEYRFGGEVPAVPAWVVDPDARNVDYVWYFGNPAGVTVERWFHIAGCRRWLTLHRDTVTDTIIERSEL
jgi:sarcosine oxidase subunit delta